MGDLATLAKARRELEDLYLGVPDDSVNLTFQDLAQVQQQQIISLEKKKSAKMELISQVNPEKEGSLSSTSPPIPKLASLNFNSGLASSNQYNHHHVLNVVVSPRNRRSHPINENGPHMSRGHHFVNGETHDGDYVHHHDHTGAHSHHREHHASPLGFRPAFESSVVYDDISHLSGTSMASMNPTLERGGRRRQGIPHSNICTICNTYTYIFRHRCLVCGRAYCRYCVSVGMGEMTEGRKCIECLGKKFIQRYIQRAGQVGCCMWYPSTVKQQELKWAEKGPRRSSDNIYRRSGVVSRSPMTPRSPNRAHGTSNSASFVMNSPYSPFSPTNHPLPL